MNPSISPTVSILMPAYNAERFIDQSVESALSQTWMDWELLLVNDGSTDRTAEIVARYADARLRVFHQENGGEASARNTALDQARGEYIAFLDADDLYLPDHLERTVSYLRAHPDEAGVYTDGYYINQDNRRLKPLSARRRGPFWGDIFEEMVRASDVFGAPLCVVIRQDLIRQQALRFDPAIVIGPDWDFLTRYAERGRFGQLEQATCLYRVHTTNISTRTNLQQRALSLARCREKAIQMDRFNECSLETRTFVFYDLLVNLLTGLPERQMAVMDRTEFQQLPADRRARLLRWMASKALLGGDPLHAREWLQTARRLNPGDLRGLALSWLFGLSPELCRYIVGIRRASQMEALPVNPFGDLEK